MFEHSLLEESQSETVNFKPPAVSELNQSGAAMQLQYLISDGQTNAHRQVVCLCTSTDSVDISNKLFFVSKDGIQHNVRQAASCLVMPQEGDWVEILSYGSQHWVISILERQTPSAPLNLNFNSPVHFELPELHIIASNNARIETRSLSLLSQKQQVITDDRVTEVKQTDVEYLGSKSTHCKKSFQVHSKFTSMTASVLIKVDAAQIHMG